MKELEISAKTVEEATRTALEQLGVTRDDVEITVIKKGKSGLLGVGSEDAKIKVVLLEEEESQQEIDDGDVSQRVLIDILHAMGIQATVDVSRSSDPAAPVTLNIEGDDLGVLIGRRGQALSSLQYLVRLVVAEKLKKWVSINVDVDWYKKRHYESLKKLALRLAEQVTRSAGGPSPWNLCRRMRGASFTSRWRTIRRSRPKARVRVKAGGW